jgi:hypothetical protein
MNLVKPDAITTTGSITRSTTGTYFDSTGTMQTAAINAVRINYEPLTGEFRGVLIENAATNLLTYSEQFDNAAWTKVGVSVTTNASTAPNGSLTADKIVITNISDPGIAQVANTGSAITGKTFTFSIYAWTDSGQPTSAQLLMYDAAVAYVQTKDIILTTTPVLYYITAAFPLAVGTTLNARLDLLQNTSAIGNYCYSWGAQLEVGSTATSYIPTVASQVTRAADIITGSGLVYTTLTESNPEWSSATTYALGANVVYGIYGTYKSLQSSNLNHTPPITSPFTDAYWVRTGPTNKMAMFDDQISSVSSATSEIIFAVTASAIDTASILNVIAAKTSISVTDISTKESVYHNSNQLSGGESIDWYNYFFYDEDTQRTSSLYLGIPAVSNSLVTVRISGTGTVTAGNFVIGQLKSLGATQYGVSAGIIDYSRKDTDEFGNIVFTRRNFSKRMNASVSLTNPNLNRVQRILYELRATPVLWIASTDSQFEEPLIIYGFYKDFSTEISYPTHSICNIQVEGLI